MASNGGAEPKKGTETILLRQPLPKYSFQGRKLPKEPMPAQKQAGKKDMAANLPPKAGQTAGMARNGSESTVPSNGLDRKSVAVRPFSSAVTSPTSSTSDKTSAASALSQKPVAAVVTPNLRPASSPYGSGVVAGSASGGVKFELGGKEVVPERAVADAVQQKSASFVSPRGEKHPITFLSHPASAGSQEGGIS